VVHLFRHADGRVEERTPPRQLPDAAVTVLDVYGDLFYAGARTFERLLPSPRGADRPAVVLRLRGRRTLGATLIDVLGHYAEELEKVNGRLYLTGVSHDAHQQVARSEKLRLHGPMRAHEATPFVWQSTRAGIAEADAWLATSGADDARNQTEST
jgi:SulP family sulfate permease